METLKYDDYLNEGFNAIVPTGDQFGQFSLKLLAARDQAHVFHWQTDSFAQHVFVWRIDGLYGARSRE